MGNPGGVLGVLRVLPRNPRVPPGNPKYYEGFVSEFAAHGRLTAEKPEVTRFETKEQFNKNLVRIWQDLGDEQIGGLMMSEKEFASTLTRAGYKYDRFIGPHS